MNLQDLASIQMGTLDTNKQSSVENHLNTPRKLWKCGDPEEYINLLPKNEGDPLGNIYNRMVQYDKVKCDAWRDEVEKLLIFAGLFSATVTTFTAISCQWLQEDHAATSAKLLERIFIQLSAISNNDTLSLTPTAPVVQPFTADPISVRVNILWFTSLILCLSTVIFGILCLQWIREFTREISVPVKVAIPIRQMRCDGLRHWKVSEIISALPIILQISVLLFFAGILEFLWPLNHAVAACCTALIGLTAVGMAFTTFSPLVQAIRASYTPIPFKHCPYKSPLSRMLLRFGVLVNILLFHSWHIRFLNGHKVTSWTSFDVAWHRISRRTNGAFRVMDNYDIGGFAAAFEWTMVKLLPNINYDITRDLFHALHTSLPRVVAREVLQIWAKGSGGDNHEVVAAVSLNQYDGNSSRAGYDLFMAWMLQRCSLTDNCRNLINELRIRSLNSIDDKDCMEQVFSRLVQNHRFSALVWDSNEDELDSQALLTLMSYHKTNCFRRHAFDIGGTLALHIKRIQVREDNVLRCYELLLRFRSIVDEVGQSATHWHPPQRFPTRQTVATPSASQSSSPNGSSCSGKASHSPRLTSAVITSSDHDQWHPRDVARFLRFLDLSLLRKWENDIERISGQLKTIRVTEDLAPLLENMLLPALAENEAISFITDDIKRNLERYHHPEDHPT